MGSLDVKEAKSQFLLLLDKVNSTHLPGFAIWLDAKLAEYKVQGIIKADDETTSQQQYPEWISRSLRQNLSFIFQGDKSPAPLGQSSPGTERAKSAAKRKLFSQPDGSSTPKSQKRSGSETDDRFTIAREVDSAEAKELHDIVIKLEESSDEDDNDQKVEHTFTSVSRPGVAETPMPSVDKTFSLQSPEASVFSSASSANVFNPNSQCSTQSNQAVTDLHSTVFGLAPTLQQSASAPSPTVPHSSPGNSKLGTPTSTICSGSSAQGRPAFGQGAAVAPNPGSASAQESMCRTVKPRNVHNDSSARPLWTKEEGVFCCTFCPATTSRKNNMEVHVRKHTGERPFACNQCDHRSTTRSNLAMHMRTHSGDKPYKCTHVHCDASFARSCNLLDHQRRQHNDNEKPVTLPRPKQK